MVEAHGADAFGQRVAELELRVVRQQGAGDHGRPLAALALTTMRAEAHITLSGDFLRMPQQAVVISGTSTRESISGNSTSDTGLAASIVMPRPANSRA